MVLVFHFKIDLCRFVANRIRHLRGIRPAAATDMDLCPVRFPDGLHSPGRCGLSAHRTAIARLAPNYRQLSGVIGRQCCRSLPPHGS